VSIVCASSSRLWKASSDKEGGGVGRSRDEEKFNDVVLLAESWSRTWCCWLKVGVGKFYFLTKLM
jgi:hypothetical protein